MLNMLYAIIGLCVGIVVALVIRFVGDYPFPWEYRLITRKQSEPDSQAIAESFLKTPNNGELHLVMGNLNSRVVGDDKVISAIQTCKDKKIRVKLIHGPETDPESQRFVDTLKKCSQTELYSLAKYPKRHFRVIMQQSDQEMLPKEVYLEEPHKLYHDIGYRHVKSRKVAEDWEELFEDELEKATRYYPSSS